MSRLKNPPYQWRVAGIAKEEQVRKPGGHNSGVALRLAGFFNGRGGERVETANRTKRAVCGSEPRSGADGLAYIRWVSRNSN